MRTASKSVMMLLSASVLLTLNLPAATLMVSQDSPSPTIPYSDWTTAARNIQDAINAARDGDTVLVSNGTYNAGEVVVPGTLPSRIAVRNSLTVRSLNGPLFTTVVGAAASDGLNGPDSVRCAYVGINSVLDGFTLSNGHTLTNGDARYDQSGGGVLCADGGTVVNCIIKGNAATYGGGAAYGLIKDCTLENNWATYGGGSYSNVLTNCTVNSNGGRSYPPLLHYDYGDGYGGGTYLCTLYHCTLSANMARFGGGSYSSTLYQCNLRGNLARVQLTVSTTAWGMGGGAYDCRLTNCILENNSAPEQGGGAANSILQNCVITGNSAKDGGGVHGSVLDNCLLTRNFAQLYIDIFTPTAGKGGGAFNSTLNNCTVTRNLAYDEGGGAYGGALNNCIVYYNELNRYVITSNPNYAQSTLSYSCTTPMPDAGEGNISQPPNFVFLPTDALDPHLQNPQVGDYHIMTGSSCINAGNNLYVQNNAKDLDGKLRIIQGCVDIGAYEMVLIPSVRPLMDKNVLATGQFGLLVNESEINRQYRLQYKANLRDANWLSIGDWITGNGSDLNLSDNQATDTSRFYRVESK